MRSDKVARVVCAPPARHQVLAIEDLLPATRPLPPVRRPGARRPPASCVGDVSLLRKAAVAIVGTRVPSSVGSARARRLARELSAAHVVVVSGLATGIDTAALTEAIRHGGCVIAVIGTPIDEVYPAENAPLQEEIARDHLLVSPFAPGTPTSRSNFPRRNRLMAALTDVTVIVEASDRSGTLHQAEECVRLGRWLFVPRSVLNDHTVRWPARFARYERMRPLTCTDDVLAVLPC